MTALRIGYVATCDPRDRWAWSGTHHYMFAALTAQGAEVVPLVPAPPRSRLARLVDRLTGTPPVPPLSAARAAGRALDAALAADPVDVLFAPVASTLVAYCTDPTPLALLSDATFRLLHRDYPDLRALPAPEAAARDALERLSIDRAALLLYPSHWAAASAIADYGADPERVRVIPFGANLDDLPDGEAVLAAKSLGARCQLLFIGRDWLRKGGAVAVDTVAGLARRGIVAELTLVGSAPDGPLPPRVRSAGNLDKKRRRDQARLRRLLTGAHFLVLPTQADCYSMVSCEANAFAVPAVVSAVGGIPSLIDDGANGLLLPPDADGDQYAAAIAAVWSRPKRYLALARGARAAHEARLNWDAWGAAAYAELAALARQPGRRQVA